MLNDLNIYKILFINLFSVINSIGSIFLGVFIILWEEINKILIFIGKFVVEDFNFIFDKDFNIKLGELDSFIKVVSILDFRRRFSDVEFRFIVLVVEVVKLKKVFFV